MKILFIYSNFEELGGVTAHMNNLKTALEKKGHEVIRLSFIKGGDYSIKHYFSKFHILNYSIDRKLINKTIKLIDDIKPDIIHVHHRSTCMSTARELFKKVQKELKIPIVATMHGFGITGCFTAKYFKPNGVLCDGNASFYKCLDCANSFKKKLVLLKHLIINLNFGYIPYFKQFDRVIVPSKALLNFALKRGLKKEKLVLLPNFGEIIVKNDINWKLPYEEFFLFVGRVCEEKGVVELIEAYKKYLNSAKHPIPLLIIGDGPLKSDLEKISKVNKNIIFLGKLPQEKIIPYYKNTLCLFVPSIWLEVQGLVLLEGIYWKCFIVSTNRGGIKETLEDYPKKIVLDITSRSELINKLYDFMKNFSKNINHSDASRESEDYLRKNSSSYYVEKLLKIYSSVIDEYSKK